MENPHTEDQLPEKGQLPDPNSGMTGLRMREIVEQARRQYAWRNASDKACDYYDGKQLTADQVKELEPLGLGELIANFVKPTVNALLGLEAKLRTDWRMAADTDEQQELAEAVSVKLMEAERETRADQACSDAYAGQIKAGLGWTYVGRTADPFEYPYKVESIHRNEIWWDWNSKKPDLTDAEWLMRERQAVSAEKLVAFFPEHEDLVRAVASGWTPEWMDLARNRPDLMNAFDREEVSVDAWDNWRNVDNRTVTLREVWYREHKRGKVMNLPDGRTVIFDPDNQVHTAAFLSGAVRPYDAVFSVWRVAIWLGPHKLMDEEWGTKRLPYVPWWGYREDRTRVPYGLIRDMIPMQDEINARRRKLMWLLSTKRAQVDSDALDTKFNDFSDLERELSRPDAIIVTNPNRANANALSVVSDLALSTQQYQVMLESQESIQHVAGVFNSMLGATDGARSGTAITQLVDQGTTAQGEINDNARYARTLTGQLLAELVTEDLSGQQAVVHVGDEGRRKPIELNKPVLDPLTGLEYRENDVSKLMVKVALQDVPSTPAYRAQTMTMMAEVLKGLPPELQSALMPYFLESTDLPKRREMADVLRKVLGLDENGQPPDPRMQQAEQMIQQLQQQIGLLQEDAKKQVDDLTARLQQALLENRNRQGELSLKARDLDLKERKLGAIEAPKAQADTALTQAKTLETRANTARTVIDAQRPPEPQPMTTE